MSRSRVDGQGLNQGGTMNKSVKPRSTGIYKTADETSREPGGQEGLDLGGPFPIYNNVSV